MGGRLLGSYTRLVGTMNYDFIGFDSSLQVQPSLHGNVHFQQKTSLHGKELVKNLKPSMKYIWILGQHISASISLAEYRD